MNRLKFLTSCFVIILLISSTTFAASYQTVKITANSLNIRQEMSLEAPIVGTYTKNDSIETLDIIDGWYKVKHAGQIAYISSDYASEILNGIPARIVGQDVNLRDLPSTQEGKILTQLSNQDILVHSKADDWYKVTSFDGDMPYEGHVFASFVEIDLLKKEEENTLEENAINLENSLDDFNTTSLIDIAKSKLGSPYKWAGEGPDTFDCSGFIKYCFKEAYGINLPHSASAISLKGTRIPKDQLQAGDLVFFSTNRSGNVNHVGIYLGNDEFIHASSSTYNGEQVHINPINKGFYDEVYKWAQRLTVE